MSRYHSYLNSAVLMLKLYNGDEPFSSFSKKFFSSNKKFGSKDRRQISHLCYCYFRMGKALQNLPVDEKILIGLFLNSNEPNGLLEALKPEWNRIVDLPINKKYPIINEQYSIIDVFPWKDELSEGINHSELCESFFIQPDLFLRIRPRYEKIVKEKLLSAEIDFRVISSLCLALPNTSKIDSRIKLDTEAVVQDYSSQKIGEFLPQEIKKSANFSVWDCCAGSGGKSLLLYDSNPAIDLSVSDIRESILVNLKKRFAKAGIKKYKSFKTDLTDSSFAVCHSPFNLILCDAPCTGSGTWSRTPEQLFFFEKEKIKQYAVLQKKIISNIIPDLKENGFLIYITCSVFKDENEEMVNYIEQEFRFELVKKELLKGYGKKADTMFVAVMKKTL